MELFDDLMESEVTIVVPYIKPIIELMMTVAAEKQLDDGARIKAIVFLGMVVKMKKKTVIKVGFVIALYFSCHFFKALGKILFFLFFERLTSPSVVSETTTTPTFLFRNKIQG